MNSLSWLLYAADVAGSLNTWLNIAFLLSLAVPIAGWFIKLCQVDHQRTVVEYGEPVAEKTPWPPFPFKALWLAPCLALASAALPSRDTVYMVAASETGEQIAKTPEAREMFDLVRKRVKDALSDTAKKQQ